MRSRAWLAFGCVCLVGGALVAVVNKRSTPTPVAPDGLTSVDRQTPDFQIKDLNDTLWTAESLQGKPWVINFWATWCGPCVEEIPSMNAAHKVLEPQGVDMLAINVGEGADAVEEFLQKIPIEFPNALGGASTLENWSLTVLPTTIVVNAEGKVIFEAVGAREWDDENLLERIVDSVSTSSLN